MAYFSTARGHCESAFALPQRLRRKNLNILLDKSGWSRDQSGAPNAEARTLIIFNEVQFCPRAREVIKYLVANRRFDYIETGSLISIKKNVKDILIP